jgi:hypothetical protein
LFIALPPSLCRCACGRAGRAVRVAGEDASFVAGGCGLEELESHVVGARYVRRDRLAEEELDGFGGEHGASHDAGESGCEPGRRLGGVAAQGSEKPVAYFVAAGLVQPSADMSFAHSGLPDEGIHSLLAASANVRAEVVIAGERLGRVVAA